MNILQVKNKLSLHIIHSVKHLKNKEKQLKKKKKKQMEASEILKLINQKLII